MHFLYKLNLAFKYLTGHFRRYIFLLIALSFGFAVITVMSSLKEGMTQSVFRSSENHYAGHIFVFGMEKPSGFLLVNDDEKIIRAVEESGISPVRVVRRTSYFREGLLYFNGKAVRQKNVFGVDWEVEKEDFLNLQYVEGSAPENDLTGTNGILISELTAGELKVLKGDQLTLQVNTRTGQKNTGTFIVQGIIKDNSIFGSYKSFVDRRYLNQLLGMEVEQYSSLGLYFQDLRDIQEKSDRLYAVLKSRLAFSPPVHNKKELTFQMDRQWEGVRYFTIPLQVYVSQVADLLTAMELISYFLYVIMVLIVMLSISVTYSLILHERTVEIGTMQAIGLSIRNVRIILVMEASLLFLLAIAAGFLTALGVLRLISLFSFSWIPGFEIFMDKGKLTASFTVITILRNILVLMLAALPAVFIPSMLISKLNLSDSLSGGKV